MIRKNKKYPEFIIGEVRQSENSLVVSGFLDRTFQGEEEWISDGCTGSLQKGTKIAFGRWKQNDESWQFLFDEGEAEKIQLNLGDKVFAIDGYWGERVEIVFDESIHWKQQVFKTDGKWDHDHCAICWGSISEHENTTYFFGDENKSVCMECYQNHIIRKDISFVPNA